MKRFVFITLCVCLFHITNAANTPGLNYKYYLGTWTTLPDFNLLTPLKTGTCNNINLDPRNRELQYAFLWQGFITIPASGTYTFETNSDDGSKLYIGSYGYTTTPLVNNDGIHPGKFVTGTIFLTAGVYPISISMFQNDGGQTIEVYWSSNAGLSRQRIADNVLSVNDAGAAASTTTNSGLTSSTRNYYFSSTDGDDSRSAALALNAATPWKTLNKLNSIMTTLQPGDAVLFKRNDVFTGSIKMTQSGTAGFPIIFSAYGTGNKPVINGLSKLTTWVQAGNGVWESNCPSGTSLNLVLVDEIIRGMGRYPNVTESNKGFMTIESHSGTSQLTDNDLNSSINWTGAEMVVRKNDWVLDRCLITGQMGKTFSFVSPTGHQPTDGYGYFIQNSPLTLDQVGEWYYNPSTKKLRVYCGANNPSVYAIKASIIDTLVYINGKNFLTFDNICFRGADVESFRIKNSNNIRIQRSDFNYTGLDAISVENSPYVTVENNTVNHSNNSGIRFYQGSNYASIKNNAVKNSGLIPGMGGSNNQQHDGIFVDSSPMNVIESNKVDSSGYCGIVFTGTNTSVKNNVVNYFCLTVNDGGGIYTWGDWDKIGRVVSNNLVLNGIGAPAGTNSAVPGGAVGIYTDDRSTHIDIVNNTVANCSRAGIYLHNSHEMNVISNTLFNNNIQLSMVHDPLEPADPIRNNVTVNNIMSSSKITQVMVENVSMLNDISSFGQYNNNYYTRPLDENGIIATNVLENGGYKSSYYNLEGWSLQYGYDQSSKKSPVKIPSFTVNNLTSPNKYVNGNFDNNINGVFINSSPGRATASFSAGGKLDGGALQVTFDSASGATNDVGTYIDFGAVTAGKNYVITFSMIGSSPHKTIKAFILQNGGSYGKLSETRFFELTTTRTENQMLFTAPTTETNAMIALEVGGKNCPFWLDNFQVHEAVITKTNPDEFIRFEFNTTATPKTVSLNGNYVDAKNTLYTGTITINPFSSMVLIKQVPPATSTQASNQRLMGQVAEIEAAEIKTKETIGMTVKVSPNPANEKLRVDVDIPAGTRTATMNIHSLAGVKLKTIPLSKENKIVPVDISTFDNGVYLVNILYDGHIVTKKFVKQR